MDVAVASADAPDVDQDREFRRFRDHWLGSSGRNAVKVRWDTAYRNWMREAQDRLTSRPGRPAPRVTAADERLAAGRDLVARLEAKEAAEAAAARATVTDVTVRAITEAQGGLF